MGFDISNVVKEMISAAERVFADEWPKVREGMEQVLTEEKDALERMAFAYICGGINEEEFKDQLESERGAFEAGVAMCKIVGKATIQRGVNAAMKVLEASVRAVL